MDTLLLDRTGWDLVLDVDGNIAVASDPYSLAQDAASAVRLRKGELWYDTTKGVDYSDVLGRMPPLALLKARLVAAALTVPGVVAAQCFVESAAGRTVTGQVQVTDEDGVLVPAAF